MVNSSSLPNPPKQLHPGREVCHGNTGSISDLGNKGSFSCSIQTGSSSLPTKMPGAIQHFSAVAQDVETECYLWQQAAKDGSL